MSVLETPRGMPSWVMTEIMGAKSPWRPRIDQWLAKHGLKPTRTVLGCGHYGCAYQLADKKTNGFAPWVLKVTRDPTEGPMCDWIAAHQQRGDGHFRAGFAHMKEVATLPHEVSRRGKKFPVFLILREFVRPNHSPSDRDARMFDVLNELRDVSRILDKKSLSVRERHYLREILGVQNPEDIWWHNQMELAQTPRFDAIGGVFEWLRSKYNVVLKDVHSGNIGERVYPQSWGDANVDGTNVGDFVIFDPGHTPNAYKVPSVLANPREGMRRL